MVYIKCGIDLGCAPQGSIGSGTRWFGYSSGERRKGRGVTASDGEERREEEERESSQSGSGDTREGGEGEKGRRGEERLEANVRRCEEEEEERWADLYGKELITKERRGGEEVTASGRRLSRRGTWEGGKAPSFCFCGGNEI
ncbi:major centromere autoantigen B-like [Zingiber officinale]|uniref:major centromere autoantigen B-like n=1 Tax=Zingiber officinale TaxID=94328 RepID=UPI001C4B3779|nr:major centromere autoantigen B-like [Zingiber officinale]